MQSLFEAFKQMNSLISPLSTSAAMCKGLKMVMEVIENCVVNLGAASSKLQSLEYVAYTHSILYLP